MQPRTKIFSHLVGDYMRDDPVVVPAETTVAQLVERMAAGHRTSALVVDAEGRSAEKHFELELALLDAVTIDRLGQRDHLRFHHGTEPLLVRGYRRLRQLFLSRLDV